jgi:hypothetical protein
LDAGFIVASEAAFVVAADFALAAGFIVALEVAADFALESALADLGGAVVVGADFALAAGLVVAVVVAADFALAVGFEDAALAIATDCALEASFMAALVGAADFASAADLVGALEAAFVDALDAGEVPMAFGFSLPADSREFMEQISSTRVVDARFAWSRSVPHDAAESWRPAQPTGQSRRRISTRCEKASRGVLGTSVLSLGG